MSNSSVTESEPSEAVDTTNLLQAILRAGLMPELGDDESRAQKLSQAAESLAESLLAERGRVFGAVTAAVDEDSSPELSIFVLAESAVQTAWVTYSNAFPERPTGLLRAVIFDAVARAVRKDIAIRNAVWFVLRTLAEDSSSGRWQPVVEAFLTDIDQQVKSDVSRSWSPRMASGTLRMPSVPGVTGVRLPDSISEKAASATMAETHFQNYPAEFTAHFGAIVKQMADLVGAAATKAETNANESLKAVVRSLGEKLRETLEVQDAVVRATVMRSDLLWWRSSMYSTSANKPYRELNPVETVIAAALDVQRIAPALSPVVIEHLLAAAIRELHPEEVVTARELAASHPASQLPKFDGEPILLVDQISTLEQGGFAADVSFDAGRAGVILFRDLQARQQLRESSESA